ncbi:MAG: thiamine phosphate synthase [Planctomycetes bacterium]|nr:thiamine phosphate synthase [Planctomycetota bacterium]
MSMELPARARSEYRIIDANFNRAREALRVLDDVARFALGMQQLVSQIKHLRHELHAVLTQCGIDELLRVSARDIEGDVGTEVTSSGEQTRSGMRGVALAAGGRLTEAMRSIEEQLKLLGKGEAALAIERLRYRAYVCEQQVLLALGSGKATQWRLCVIVSEEVCIHMPWYQVVEQAINGGADCIQLREKRLSEREFLRRARDLVEICRPRHVASIVNDRADLALLAGVDGLHVGQTDLPAADLRRLIGGNMLLGVSTSTIEEARRAARDSADYTGVGPMFASTTKKKETLSGPEYLREYLADEITSRLPHLAISGISQENIGELARAGCKGIAVSSAVCKSSNPADAARALVEALTSSAAR